MKQKRYKRLSYSERVKIETLLQEGFNRSEIAIKLRRSRSTITREVNYWVMCPNDKYNAEIANTFAKEDYLKKHSRDKISSNSLLRYYVYKGLLNELSPEIISGRIKLDYPDDYSMRISHEAIYCHIYSHRQAKLNKKLIACLLHHKSMRYKKTSRKGKGSSIKDRVSIEARPQHIDLREEIGHWEGDLVVGPRKSAIGTLVERKARYTKIIKVKNRKSKSVVRAFSKNLNEFKAEYRKSLTYDNGVEMAKHKLLSLKTGVDVYFAHAYSSWERGTNENTNGLIRRFFPKGTDFNLITEKQLQEVEDWLNNRPRKVLGYRTPAEVMASEFS